MYNSIEIIENGLLIESATFLEDARSKVCTSEPNKMSKNTFLGLDIKISFIVSRGFVQMENQGLSARLN